ncbi:hypothetical protein GPL15_14295 [Clostridium sp. MCC353]|uniref:SLC13 family permease n=1 Tax=Clostridium sp. MCC353 TaxID=2592646 RepID=UPI001C0336F0|nr:SLC13 family permease [Clostridium sp. MCC353]MBT9777671.1 hypothetical protein [Clostridium sp. MCC353]
MSMILIAAAFVLAVFLNKQYRINLGLTAVASAYLIGCFVLGMKPGVLKEYIPIKIIFPVVSITLFYGTALENGTLIKVVNHFIGKNRKNHLLPVMLFLCCIGMGFVGLDAGTITMIMAPIALSLTNAAGIQPLAVMCAVLLGAPIGSNYMFAAGGTIIRGIIEELTSDSALGMKAGLSGFIDCGAVFITLFAIVAAVSASKEKTQDAKRIDRLEEAEKLTGKQKLTVFLILTVTGLITVSAVFNAFHIENGISEISAKADIGFLALLGTACAACMNLSDMDTVIRRYVPWKIIIMISGISILMGTAREAGLIDMLSSALNGNIPGILLPASLVAIAGIMSFFSSALSVVIPTLCPLIPLIAENSDISQAVLYSCIIIGSSATGLSPFSTGGALVISSVSDETKRDSLVYKLLALSVVNLMLSAAYMTVRGIL